MTCKTCRFLAVPLDAAGRRVVRKERVYDCVAPCPQPPLPMSITDYYHWHWPPLRARMIGDDGEGCPTYEPYKNTPAGAHDERSTHDSRDPPAGGTP